MVLCISFFYISQSVSGTTRIDSLLDWCLSNPSQCVVRGSYGNEVACILEPELGCLTEIDASRSVQWISAILFGLNPAYCSQSCVSDDQDGNGVVDLYDLVLLINDIYLDERYEKFLPPKRLWSPCRNCGSVDLSNCIVGECCDLSRPNVGIRKEKLVLDE